MLVFIVSITKRKILSRNFFNNKHNYATLSSDSDEKESEESENEQSEKNDKQDHKVKVDEEVKVNKEVKVNNNDIEEEVLLFNLPLQKNSKRGRNC